MISKRLFLLPLFLFFCTNFSIAQFDLPKDLSEDIHGVFQLDTADMDQDGDIDLLVTSTSKLLWYRNNGGTFELEQHVLYTVAEAYHSIDIVDLGDLDNDGDLDIVFLERISNVVYNLKKVENLGGGSFTMSTVFNFVPSMNSSYVYFQLGDIDNDGNLDVVEANKVDNITANNQLNWMKGNGNGTFMPLANIDIGVFVGGFKLFDVDVDGDLDIFYKNSNKIIVQKNLGSTQFSAMDTIADVGSFFLDFVDLNDDGYDDLVSSTVNSGQNTTQYYLLNVAGILGVPVQFGTGPYGVECVNHGDFDNDGDEDILVGYKSASYNFGTSSFRWYENVNGSFATSHLIDGFAVGLRETAVADFNGNGADDVVVTIGAGDYGQNNTIAMYENDLSGLQYPYTPIIEQADGVREIDFGDLDSDGLTDVIVTSYNDRTISWHKNLGGNNWGDVSIISELATTQYTQGFHSSVVLDIDNDGDEDIVTAGYWDVTLLLYRNLGGGAFSDEIVLSSSYPNVLYLDKADMNNDGFDDLIIGQAGINAGTVWLENTGAGGFSTEHFIHNAYIKPVLSDLDQDGNIDVVGFSSGGVSWWRNLGSGTLAPASTLTSYTLTNPYVVRVADMNNDGELDLVIGSAQSSIGRITIAYNNGGATSFTNEIIQTFSSVNLNTLVLEDFDLDGDMDMFVLRYAGYGQRMENNGGGQFLTSIFPVSQRASGVTAASSDFDNDGDQDLFLGNSGSGISVLENLELSPLKASGKVYFDVNNNGVFDANDIGTNQFNVSSTFADAIIDMNPLGNYSIVYQDSAYGIYQSQPVLSSNWGISSSPMSYQQVINGSYTSQVNNDFGLYPTNFENDVNVDFTGGFAGCTDLVNIWVALANKGTTRANINHELTLANGLYFASSSFTPDSVVGQTVYWHTDSLFYFSDSVVSLQVATPNSTFAGDTMVSTLISVVSDASGATPLVFYDTISQVINCTLPVNHKSGMPKGVGTDGFIDPSTTSLEYLILFQNSTSSTAEHLWIRDLLDTNLVFSSFEVISSSHPVEAYMQYTFDNYLYMNFDQIHLPNLSSNYIGSKGYVKFKVDIKPNRPYLTRIRNMANITWDGISGPNTNGTTHTFYNCDSVLSTSAIISSELCDGELVTGNIQDNITSTDFTWSIPNVVSQTNNSFSWVADTAGLFNVQISVSNEYCNSDSSIALLVHPRHHIVTDSVAICVGDSILLFGDFRSTAGIYLDSLQSIFGCDSIISTELVEMPLPNVSFYSSVAVTCVNSVPVVLSDVSPANGQFSGPGIVSNTFDPSMAGIGVHTLFYEYTDLNGCSSSDSIQIVVDGCAETDELDVDNSIFSANYDPNNDLLTLVLNESQTDEYTYGIYAMNGQLIVEDILNDQPKKIKTHSFEHGVYFILIQNARTKGESRFKKILLY